MALSELRIFNPNFTAFKPHYIERVRNDLPQSRFRWIDVEQGAFHGNPGLAKAVMRELAKQRNCDFVRLYAHPANGNTHLLGCDGIASPAKIEQLRQFFRNLPQALAFTFDPKDARSLRAATKFVLDRSYANRFILEKRPGPCKYSDSVADHPESICDMDFKLPPKTTDVDTTWAP